MTSTWEMEKHKQGSHNEDIFVLSPPFLQLPWLISKRKIHSAWRECRGKEREIQQIYKEHHMNQEVFQHFFETAEVGRLQVRRNVLFHFANAAKLAFWSPAAKWQAKV